MKIHSFQSWLNRINETDSDIMDMLNKSFQKPVAASTYVAPPIMDKFTKPTKPINKEELSKAINSTIYVPSLRMVLNPESSATGISHQDDLPNAPYSRNNAPNLEMIPRDLSLYCLRWFLHAGLSMEGASALVANLWRESYLNPNQVQISGGPGTGLAQWSKTDRWATFRNEFLPKFTSAHPKLTSLDMFDLDAQLGFILYELKSRQFYDVYQELCKPGNLREKTVKVLSEYEIARDRKVPKEQNIRYEIASKMYSILASDSRKDLIEYLVSNQKAVNAESFV
jgi:hypothetical protein